MARKIKGFERVLDAPALFAIAYGEIGASIYIALGIVASAALGLTPLVLAVTGVLFLIVSLSYAEGTAAIPETGGAETFTRRAFNDLVGFVTGWALFLDYLIVIALSALFLPHYVGAALDADTLRDSPWDVVVTIVGDPRDRRGTARSADPAVSPGARRRAARPRRPAADRRPRARAPVLTRDSRRRPLARPGSGLARRPALRGAPRVPRVHRPRDGRQSRGGGPRAGTDAAALAVLGDRPRRRPDGARRDGGRDGVPGDRRIVRAGRRMARGADRRHRDRLRGRAPRSPCRRAPRGRRVLRGAHPADGPDDVHVRMRTARPFDGHARDAAAGDRAARTADARLAPGDRRHHAGCDRSRRRRRRRR